MFRCRWVSGWEPCLTTWNTSHATSSPVISMPSWCQPTSQLWMLLTNLCQGRTDWRGEIRSSIVKLLIWIFGRWHVLSWFSLSGQFRPEWLQLRASPGPGLSSDVWCRALPCPPSTFCQHWGRSLPCQSNNRREGAVLRVTVCRYPSNPHVWRHTVWH